jgi:hypothetical protein
MTISHRQFEIDCALAASGQLADREFAEFTNHLHGCDLCQNRLCEMALVGGQLALARKSRVTVPANSKGMLERFIARASREGIQLKPRKKCPPMQHLAGVSALALVSALLVAVTWTAVHNASWANSASRTVGPELWRSVPTGEETARPIHAPKAPVRVTRHSAATNKFPSYHKIETMPLSGEVLAAEKVLPETLRAFEQYGNGDHTSGSAPLLLSMPPLFQVTVSYRSSFNPDAKRIEDLFLKGNKATVFGKRAFSYDPRVASLTLLESFHMTASTIPSGFSVDVPAFRFALPTNQ